jgi:cytochrome d ubiquinol oxidase subunit I
MGVVSGITMSFQFGTNWPGFMESVGNVAGPLLAYEVLTAFFLEAAFLGIMLFGWRRVPDWVHTTATVLVAFGTTLSAFWILVLNSWMHTPAGYELRDGVVYATDWWAIIFNPSMPYRLAHVLLASGLTVAFLIAGLSAFRWLIGDRTAAVRKGLTFGMWLGAILIPIQILAGDMHGLNTLEHQPAKVAAMEGNWETRGNVPLLLFAIPDEEARTNHFEIGIPSMASVILKHSPSGVVPGLNDFVAEDGTALHPPVAPVFWSFRVMVATGMAMLAVSWFALWSMRRGRGVEALPKVLLFVLVAMTFSGWLATLAGWYTTEIGRQPWLVTGVLTTAQAVADVPAGMVLSTLLGYLGIYAILTLAYVGVLFHLARKAARGETLDERPKSGAAIAVVTPAE